MKLRLAPARQSTDYRVATRSAANIVALVEGYLSLSAVMPLAGRLSEL